jgi:hypothetical protein
LRTGFALKTNDLYWMGAGPVVAWFVEESVPHATVAAAEQGAAQDTRIWSGESA